ncbi:NTP transferase domain-containing protein [Paeniglutamicibacter sp. NPDC091659]|uniref:nucleotidyltransferase family protein n=1 Tax=Paeniglutamicibacter sp. NPDC091659 TaxID=3364389 RepID=UPI003822F760
MTNPANRPPCYGVVLAAGSGSRLGRGPKALLVKSNGETLLNSAVQALLLGGCDEVVVVLGAEAQRVAAHLRDVGVKILINDRWSTGMGSSFALGMAAVPPGAGALVALVDQPGMDADVVRRLRAAHRPGRITAAGYRQGTEALKRGHPVLFAPEHTQPAAAAAAGDAGARAYLAAHRELIDIVDCSDLDTGSDVDTVLDLHLLGED